MDGWMDVRMVSNDHACTDARIHGHVYTHTHDIHKHTLLFHVFIHTCIYAQIRSYLYMHTCVRTYIHKPAQTHRFTHAYIHTHIHTYAHVYAHTHRFLDGNDWSEVRDRFDVCMYVCMFDIYV